MNLTFPTARDLIAFEMDAKWILKAFPARHCVRYNTSRVSLLHNRVSCSKCVCVPAGLPGSILPHIRPQDGQPALLPFQKLSIEQTKWGDNKAAAVRLYQAHVYSASNQLHQHSARATGGSWRKSRQGDQLCVSHILFCCFILNSAGWQVREEKVTSDVFSSSISE